MNTIVYICNKGFYMSCQDKLNEFYKKRSNLDAMIYSTMGKIKNSKQLDWVELKSTAEDLISDSVILTFEKCKEISINNFIGYLKDVLKNKVLNYNRLKSSDLESMDRIKNEPISDPYSYLDSLDEEVIKIELGRKFNDQITVKIFKMAYLDSLPPRDIEVMTGITNQIIRNRIIAIRKFLEERRHRYIL